jgi:dihydrofolate reductase
MTPPRIGIIVARDAADGIGREGGLAWKYPADLRFCRNVTLGCGLLMGRKTWESIPANLRPLSQRRSFVLSSRELYPPGTPYPEGVRRCHNVAAAVAAASAAVPEPLHFLWIFGGATLYNDPELRKSVCEIYETVIPGDHHCDTGLEGWQDYLREFTPDWEAVGSDGPSPLIFRHHRRG